MTGDDEIKSEIHNILSFNLLSIDACLYFSGSIGTYGSK
jgi:hypothetical protein